MDKSMRPILYPYKMGSNSAKALANALSEFRAKRVYPDRTYRPYNNHLIINWGNSTVPRWINNGAFATVDGMRQTASWLNWPGSVHVASDKLLAFQALKYCGVSIPEFTTEEEVANEWLRKGHVVVSRLKLNGHSGSGIRLAHPEEIRSVRNAPLHVKYVKKKHEYRVHVFNGKVIDVQQKRKVREVPNEQVDYQVRNYHTGWIYARDNIDFPSVDIGALAVDAVAALGLDFGAVDIIWNEYMEKAYVLEVNTAPGLSGTTLTNYVNAIKEIL